MIVPIDPVANIVVFQYNPYEVHFKKDIKWRGIHSTGREQPVFQYGCGEGKVLGFSIEVSRYNNSDFFVKGFFDSLLMFSKPLVKGMGIDRPPKLQIILGQDINMTGFIDDIHIRYGSHRGQTGHFAYPATPDTLLPKEGHVIVKFVEYI